MTAPAPSKRTGFTFIELLTVMVLLGILGGIALPNLRSAIFRADAAKIVTDMTAVRFAVLEFREENGSLPRTARCAATPPDLIPYLDQMPFSYKDVEYRLFTNNRQGKVEFSVRYPRRSLIGDALKRFRSPGGDAGSVSWTSRETKFRILVGTSSGPDRGRGGSGRGRGR